MILSIVLVITYLYIFFSSHTRVSVLVFTVLRPPKQVNKFHSVMFNEVMANQGTEHWTTHPAKAKPLFFSERRQTYAFQQLVDFLQKIVTFLLVCKTVFV